MKDTTNRARAVRRMCFTQILMLFFCIYGTLYADEKGDALTHYRTGRNLDAAGRTEEAKEHYTEAVRICQNELKNNSRNMDSYTVYTWSLFRLHHYRETVAVCNEALKIASDRRIIETLGEAYFFVGDYKNRYATWNVISIWRRQVSGSVLPIFTPVIFTGLQNATKKPT